MNDIILVSGGFDPIHSGHINLIKDASKYGDVVVLLNSDAWLIQKKGKEFLPYKEREMIMNALKSVIDVIAFEDSDKTCVDGIRKAIEKYPNQKITKGNIFIVFKYINNILHCFIWNLQGKVPLSLE